MSLKERINEDIKAAMRSKDQAALRALRAIKSAILLAETAAGAKGELSEGQELEVLSKQAKQRRDSIEQFRANNREDLANQEEEELEIINKYLPNPMTGDEIEAEIRQIIEETGASGMQDMGKVMGQATGKMKGKAEGQTIAEMVKKLLAEISR